MLIKVVPGGDYSTILFAVTFQDLPDGLPQPVSWSNQLHSLVQDDLEVPDNIHALDKAVWITCVLNEVCFNTSTLTVSCQFIDGHVEEWPLIGAEVLAQLEDVLFDVNESALETDREREREIAKAREQERRRSESLNSPPPSVKVTRHKKSRSLLMSLVASIVPLSASCSLSHRTPSLPPPTPTKEEEIPHSQLSARAYRRRARSALVDVLRRTVFSKIKRCLPPGGYYTWLLQSHLHKAMGRLSYLLEQAEGQACHVGVSAPKSEVNYFAITATEPPSPYYSDEDDNDSGETDTDSSSVHTPSTSHFDGSRHARKPATIASFTFEEQSQSHSGDYQHHYLTQHELAEYQELSVLAQRWHQLLTHANSRLAHTEIELANRDAILEVRSRRRAWLNKSLVNSSSMDVGLGMPFKSSPLAQASWSSDEYEFVHEPLDLEAFPRECTDEEYEELEVSMRLRSNKTRGIKDARLFPVTEEEEDDAHNLRELELEMGLELDLEGGNRFLDDDDIPEGGSTVRVSIEVDAPRFRPRMRTSSMYQARQSVPLLPLAPSSPNPLPVPPKLMPSSILCQPLSCMSLQQLDTDLQMKYQKTEVTVNELSVSGCGDFGTYTPDAEFTLAMDLPLKIRVSDREVLRKRPVLSSAIEEDRMRNSDFGWIPGSSPTTCQ